MNVDKSSFIFRKRYFNQISNLTTEQKAELLDKICEYQTNWTRTITMDSTDMLISIMVDERKNDDEKYLELCEKNRENWRLWWAKKWNQNARKNWGKQPKQPNATERYRMPPKQADNDNNSNTTIITSNKETSISKDIDTKKEEFETFWKTFPHARKWKKNESYEYFKKLDTDEVMKQTQILVRKIRAWLEESKYIPACERWIRDFTPLNDEVIKQDLTKICKRHLTTPWDEQTRKQRAMELKQTFWEETIKNTIKQLNSLQLNFTT